MREKGLWTFTEAARECGVYPVTIGDLVRVLGITPKAMTNGQAKGLDATDMRMIRRALRLDRRRKSEPVPA